ncbi:MAG: transglycosylase family protein [Dermatophilaceae bacterium]
MLSALLSVVALIPGVPVADQADLPLPTVELELEEVAAALEEIIVTSQQELLADLGWYEGEVDGIHGSITEAALEEFHDAADIEEELNWLELLGEMRDEGAPHAPVPEPPPDPTPVPSNSPAVSSEARYGVGEPWATLAECESGNWINGGASFERGSARWNWAKPGTSMPSWGTAIHHGGLQHHPGTWNAFKGLAGVDVDFAYNATPQQQVAVAREVQKAQGWRAWPVCSQKVGLR